MNKYISRLGSNLWLDIRDLWLNKAVNPEYAREVFVIRYEIKSCMIMKPSSRLWIKLLKIRKYLIVGQKRFNNWWNSSSRLINFSFILNVLLASY